MRVSSQSNSGRPAVRLFSIPRDGFVLLRTPPFLGNSFSNCPREWVTTRAIFNPSRLTKPSPRPLTPIQEAARHFVAFMTGRFTCPECGHAGPHEDNGAKGEELVFCCAGCGMHIDADRVNAGSRDPSPVRRTTAANKRRSGV